MRYDGHLGLEELQLAFFERIQEALNDHIEQEEQRGIDLDARVATAYGVDPKVVSLEQFDRANIHYGHRPSMIEAPISEYPSMAIQASAARPNGPNATADYGSSYNLVVTVELIVKSGPYKNSDDREFWEQGADLVGRRLHRTVEAVVMLINADRTLGGKLYPADTAPTVVLGEIFQREEDGESATGASWHWQGARIEFTYPKQTVFGQSNQENF